MEARVGGTEAEIKRALISLKPEPFSEKELFDLIAKLRQNELNEALARAEDKQRHSY